MQEVVPFIQENIIWVVAWVGLLVALIITMIKEKSLRYKFLPSTEAIGLVNHHEGVFVDIRSRDQYRTGYIAGAINITEKDIKEKNLAELEKLKDKPVIIVCDRGLTAADSANSLIDQGFEQINVLKDGLMGWNEANLPLVRQKKKKK